MNRFYDDQGDSIEVGSQLGRGGEATIYEVKGKSSLAAKLYESPISDEKQRKLSAMIALQNERLLRLAAWPIGGLHLKPRGPIAGFLMRRLVEPKQIDDLYGVKSRLIEFPQACWPFLVHAASNLARAFSVTHELGFIIGDVKPQNIIVFKDATVHLLDCDSFQITTAGKSYPCDVLTPAYAPPELHNQTDHVSRTINHDSFGLAVLIFQLLFLGRHPFIGRYLGEDDMPVERAIEEFRFAYGPDAASRQMGQPPATLHLQEASSPIAGMFEQAFLQTRNRPSASEWVSSLTEFGKTLKKCDQNLSHDFLRTLSHCPW